jgi:phosphoglycolate phosphatase-like HAD superfamily hydrolase
MHLVWDWNGTLLDDFELTVAATNAAFAADGGPRVTGEQHRRLFRRPIHGYYAEVLGRPIDDAAFARLDGLFHAEYERLLPTCRLADGALEALAGWGGSQSLLSMWFHDQLVPFVAGFGLTGYFRRIDGLRDQVGGGGKAEHLVRHLAALGVAGTDCVLIGDTLDDADAAAAVGAGCVLVSGGFTDAERLAGSGLPVAGSLAEAVTLASSVDSTVH